MSPVEQFDRDVFGHHLRVRAVDVGLAIRCDLRPRVGDAHDAAAVEWEHVVLTGFAVPQRNHFDAPLPLRVGKADRLGRIGLDVIQLPAGGIQFAQFVLGELEGEDKAANSGLKVAP